MFLFHWHPSRSAPKDHYTQWNFVILRLAVMATLLTTLLGALPAAAEGNEATAVQAPFGVEYAVPNGPRNLVEEAPGRIWYTATEAGGIGFLEVISDPDEPVIRYRTDFYGLGEVSEPYDLVYHNGVVWFTLRGIRSLGRIDTATREIKTYPLLTVGAAPTGIDVAPDGMLWIAQNNGRISRFDPTSEIFTEYIMPDPLAAQPRVEDIVYQNARNVWFTMPDSNLVVAYDTVRDRFFGIATGHLQPMGLTFDSEGSLWVTTYGDSRIGRYTPTTVSLWVWYDTVTPDSGPVGVLAFKNSQNVLDVWVTENKTGTIARMQIVNTFEVVTRERLGPNAPSGNTWGIIRSSDGNIWVADTGRNLLYEIKPPYVHRTYIASVVKEPPQ